MQRWTLVSRNDAEALKLAQLLEIPLEIAHLLIQRGIREASNAKIFLDPQLKSLLDPETLPDIDKASKRLVEAIHKQELIVIYGDYDVDGVTGATILFHVLTQLGANVDYYIADRFTEGYGLASSRIQKLAEKGVQVIVSVDIGCTAVEQADLCLQLGIDLIITDHHTLPRGSLPNAFALIHPKTPQSTYLNREICGAGVAYKLAWAVARKKEGTDKLTSEMRQYMMEMLGLASLGTIADVVSLIGEENRSIVRYGLKMLSQSTFPGIRSLLEVAQIKSELDSSQVSWKIAPLINSAGRMASAQEAFQLLSAKDTITATHLSNLLKNWNDLRKDVQQKIIDSAFKQYTQVYGSTDDVGIVLASESWHEGVLGIVAARIANYYHQPAMVLAISSDGIAKGSGRSVAGIDLLALLEQCQDLLISFGGHPAALGLRVAVDQIPVLRKRLSVLLKQLFQHYPELAHGSKQIDLHIALEKVNADLMHYLKCMEPTGEGNPKPFFLASPVQLPTPPSLMGKAGEHLNFVVAQNEHHFRCVAFNMGERFEELKQAFEQNLPLHIIFKPDWNEFRNRRMLELYLQDFSTSWERLLTQPPPVSFENSER